ncbi:MAG: ion transporter [Planctomycetota bacterium]|nr:MAG: ion transporter [Planctomycetota bacterium]
MEREITVQRVSNELKDTTYELFIGALSVLSIINLLLYYLIESPIVSGVIAIIDAFLSLIFLADFLYRLFTADSKTRYFFVQFGWADLLASLPFPQAKILRVFRIFRAGRLMGKRGARHMVREFLGNRAQSALLTLLFLIIVVLEFGGMGMVAVEGSSPEANIRAPSDALWYTYVTITTVGYGDRYPVTTEGRLIGIVIMTAGVGLFGTLTGYLANAFLAPPRRKEEQTADADNPKAKLAELKQLLDEQKQVQAVLETKISEIEALL